MDGQLVQHGAQRVRAGGGRGQCGLRLGDLPQVAVAGLGHRAVRGPADGDERCGDGDAQQRQPVPVAGGDQLRRHLLVHRGDAEAERGGARPDHPAHVRVDALGALREPYAGGEQQFAAEQVRRRVLDLGGADRADQPVVGRAGDLHQAERGVGEQDGERYGGGAGRGGVGEWAGLVGGGHCAASRLRPVDGSSIAAQHIGRNRHFCGARYAG